MGVIEAIKTRATIRKYQDKPIPKEAVMDIINAARLAPSGSNTQPTRFCIIENKEEKNRLKPAFIQDFVCKAPLIIVLCGNPDDYDSLSQIEKQRQEDGMPGKRGEVKNNLAGKNNQRTLRDISIASAFMIPRAHELGLGSCYIGLLDEQILKKELNIDGEWLLPFAITFGYSAEDKSPTPKKDINQNLEKSL